MLGKGRAYKCLFTCVTPFLDILWYYLKHRKSNTENTWLVGPNCKMGGDFNRIVCLLQKVRWKKRGAAGHRYQVCTWQNNTWNPACLWICCLYFKRPLVNSCIVCKGRYWYDEMKGHFICWDLEVAPTSLCCPVLLQFSQTRLPILVIFSMSLETKTKAAFYNCTQ